MATEQVIDGKSEQLRLVATIGFAGSVPGGLIVHPSNNFVIYPLGSTVVLQSVNNKLQYFLRGHSDAVSALAVSRDGLLVASGQRTSSAERTDIIVWNFETKRLVWRFTQHLGHTQSLCFSPSGKYLVSIGSDADNAVVLWDLTAGASLAGSPVSKGNQNPALCASFLNGSDDTFVTGGTYLTRVWQVERLATVTKIRPTDCNMGGMHRVVTCCVVQPDDTHMLCGTTTGDILLIDIHTGLLKASGPTQQNKLFSKGVTALALTPNGNILVGSGTGMIACLSCDGSWRSLRTAQVNGAVTTLTKIPEEPWFYCGTDTSRMYLLDGSTLEPTLANTCHTGPITSVCFPQGYSEVFLTAGADIRAWNAITCKELLKISVPDASCNNMLVTRDGRSIISSWTDLKIRAFGPQSGRQKYVMNDVHAHGVASFAATYDASRLVTGSTDGEIRYWEMGANSQTLLHSVKIFKKAINSMNLRDDDSQIVCAVGDGSIVVFQLTFTELVRSKLIAAEHLYKTIAFHPHDKNMVLAGGLERKFSYWDLQDGRTIRELPGAAHGPITCLDFSEDGDYFAAGISTGVVRYWSYNDGKCVARGEGHNCVNAIRISPDQHNIVSCGLDGAVFIWEVPASTLAS